MKVYSDNGESYGYYGYDDQGERTYKIQYSTVSSRVNRYGVVTKTLETDKITYYPNGYINIDQYGNYTKHYYADELRVCSKIGSGNNSESLDASGEMDFFRCYDTYNARVAELGEVIIPAEETNPLVIYDEVSTLNGDNGSEDELFFYYGNHLSSTQVVTDNSGSVVQAVLYAPFGEIISEYNAYHWQNGVVPDYKFNGKELDEESGMYYYSARYYAPPSFISRDPLFEKQPFISPYAYCNNNPVKLIDPDGLYPRSILTFNPKVGLNGGYKFTKSATHLLSLVSGINKTYIENAVVQERAPGQYRPWYSSNKGGGAMVLSTSSYNATITFTENFFADDPSAYNGHGYGQDVMTWLALASHEVGHIPQINQKGGLLGYLASFGLEYLEYGHDAAPSEIEADKGYNTFMSFNSFVNDNYGRNSIKNLFESDNSEAQKIKTIDKWWAAFKDHQKQQETKSQLEF